MRTRGLHEIFEIGIVLKGVGAAFETVLGVALLFSDQIALFVLELVNNELLDDPNDFFATHVRSLVAPAQGEHIFGALYLLSHGIVKMLLVAGLLRNKLWAYPASLAVFSLFILYELVRFTRTHSLWLFAFMLMDVGVMTLIYYEYHHRRRRKDDSSLVL